MPPVELFEELRVTGRLRRPTPYPFHALSPLLHDASPVLGPERERRYNSDGRSGGGEPVIGLSLIHIS
ncbi:hypothetical protein, partial [Streptomyces resistomycificus]|uniref:hypothetical protein n=1 Tax=Streptomyces resistomycificus TaxID=67356 RepID=UPI001ADFBE2D